MDKKQLRQNCLGTVVDAYIPSKSFEYMIFLDNGPG